MITRAGAGQPSRPDDVTASGRQRHRDQQSGAERGDEDTRGDPGEAVHVAGVQRQGDELRVHQEADERHHADAAGEAGAGEHPQVDDRARPPAATAPRTSRAARRRARPAARSTTAAPRRRSVRSPTARRRSRATATRGRAGRCRRRPDRRDRSATTSSATTATTSPSGTLMRKIHRQWPPSTSRPPSSGPSTGATFTTSDSRPITVPTRRPSAVRAASVRAVGSSAPPPNPCTTRKAINDAGRPRQARQRRAEDEDGDPGEEHPPPAEALDRPSRDRQRHGGRQQVSDADPADGGDRAVERRRERVDGDRHDGAVEDGHEGGRRHHGDDRGSCAGRAAQSASAARSGCDRYVHGRNLNYTVQ